MDLVRLGEYNNVDPTYLPDKILDGFTSKIWTERYLENGEFILTTPYVDEMMEILPEHTFISHRHTREVMQVQTHSISTNDVGVETLTISGSSVDSILKSRFIEGRYNKRRKMPREYTPTEAALVIMWNALDNDADPPYDVTRQRMDGEDNGDLEGDGDRWPWNGKDKLPNVAVSDSASGGIEETRRWWLREGLLYEQLTRILHQGDLGLRTLRPPTATLTHYGTPDPYSGERIWVKSTLGEFGEVQSVIDTNYPELRFDLFKGVDRSVNQSTNAHVIFNLRRDHFRSAEHLYSVAEWKTAMEVMSGLNRKWDIYRWPYQAAYTGWQRRVMAMDAGAPDIPDAPDKPGKNASAAEKEAYEDKYDRWIIRRNRNINEFEEDYKKDGKKELNKFKKVYLFSGEVSDEGVQQYVYGTHYNLGDLVTLRGRDGITETAKVTEYVLTEDGTGQHGYPGLELQED